MKKLIPLLLLSSIATADDIRLTWNLATEREDGTALPQSMIKEHIAFIIDKNGAGTEIQKVPCCVTEAIFKDITPGEWVGYIMTIDTDGEHSIPTDNLELNVKPRPGNPKNQSYEIKRKTVEETIKTIEETITVAP